MTDEDGNGSLKPGLIEHSRGADDEEKMQISDPIESTSQQPVSYIGWTAAVVIGLLLWAILLAVMR